MNKRAFGIVAASALAIAALAAPAAAAPAQRTAWDGDIIVAIDNVGNWTTAHATGSLTVNSNVWTLTASADQSYDLDHAVVLDPASSGWSGGCFAGVGVSTQDWQSVTTPSGKTKLVCHGVIA